MSFTVSQLNRAILTVNTQALEMGAIDVNVPRRDTTFLLTNTGLLRTQPISS